LTIDDWIKFDYSHHHLKSDDEQISTGNESGVSLEIVNEYATSSKEEDEPQDNPTERGVLTQLDINTMDN